MGARRIVYISHAEVIIDPARPIASWSLSDVGRLRHLNFGRTALAQSVTTVFMSNEVKAREAAEAMFPHLAGTMHLRDGMHENDRASTGYLPSDEFEDVADQFFAVPDLSVRGWERAIDAQARIVAEVEAAAAASSMGDIVAIVGHGGVGTLLYCHYAQQPISRRFDQPGNGGGNVMLLDPGPPAHITPWMPMETFS